VNLLRVAFTKIAAEHAKLSPESVLALAVCSVNSMKTSNRLSRLEIDCGRPARHPLLSEELFSLSPPVLPASTHEIEELMNAADEKRQLHQVMCARQRLDAPLRAQVLDVPRLFVTETRSCIGVQVSCALRVAGEAQRYLSRSSAIWLSALWEELLFYVTGQGIDCSNAHPATKSQVRYWMTTHFYLFKEKELILQRRPR
jgi:hypothetical protein